MKLRSDRFYLGSHLCREPMPPMPELKHDMEVLRDQGFNLIKLQEHWAVDEPTEGRYDFSRYEELIEYAAQLDLEVYLGLTCEQAPRWLYEKYPDCRMIGIDEYPINHVAATTLPADGKPGPCFDHPGALEAELRFITELVRTLGRYENIAVWNTWQEIGYWAEGLVGRAVCYCPNTIAGFRSWLHERYGDLDELNRRWNARFADWNSVFPDTQNQRKSATPHAIEFAYYMENIQIARVLESRSEAIRNADPLERPIFAHKGGPEIASAVDWTYASCQDFLGTSAYPAWGSFHSWDDGRPAAGERFDRHCSLSNELWANLAMRFDHLRSCNRDGAPVWAAEFQGGPVSTGLHKGRVPSREDMRRWMLTTLASGATAISFWVTRAEIMADETNGFSLLDSTGDTTPRFEEAACVGAALQRYPDLFASPTLEAARVGILVDEWNYRLCGTLNQAKEHLVYSTRGWYRMLWDTGISVDFVDTRELERSDIPDYALLIAPFPISISDDVFLHLSRYVEAGGYLVSEACPGRLDRYARATRGEISRVAATLFGAEHAGLVMVREPENGFRWMPGERTWGEFDEYRRFVGCGVLEGCSFGPSLYVETFTPNDGESVMTCDGLTTGVVNRSGSGAAMLIGSLVGHQGNAYRSPEQEAMVARILDWAGIRTPASNVFPSPICPPVCPPTGDTMSEATHDQDDSPASTGPVAGLLLRRVRKAGNREAWFFTNPHRDPVREIIDVSGYDEVFDLLDDVLERKIDAVELVVESLDVRVLILEKKT